MTGQIVLYLAEQVDSKALLRLMSSQRVCDQNHVTMSRVDNEGLSTVAASLLMGLQSSAEPTAMAAARYCISAWIPTFPINTTQLSVVDLSKIVWCMSSQTSTYQTLHHLVLR